MTSKMDKVKSELKKTFMLTLKQQCCVIVNREVDSAIPKTVGKLHAYWFT